MRVTRLAKPAAFLAGVVASFGLIGRAQGAVMTDSIAIPSGTASGSFQLPDFNPALGTLTGVSISYAETYTSISQILDFTGAGGSYSGAFANSSSISLTSPDGTAATSPGVDAGPFSGTIAPVGHFNITSLPGTPDSESLGETVLPANFSSYEGVGSGTYGFSAIPITSGGSPTSGSLGFGGTGSFSGTASVAYTYTPVPEPTALSLMAVGGLGLLRRRRKLV